MRGAKEEGKAVGKCFLIFLGCDPFKGKILFDVWQRYFWRKDLTFVVSLRIQSKVQISLLIIFKHFHGLQAYILSFPLRNTPYLHEFLASLKHFLLPYLFIIHLISCTYLVWVVKVLCELLVFYFVVLA